MLFLLWVQGPDMGDGKAACITAPFPMETLHIVPALPTHPSSPVVLNFLTCPFIQLLMCWGPPIVKLFLLLLHNFFCHCSKP